MNLIKFNSGLQKIMLFLVFGKYCQFGVEIRNF